MYIRTLSALFLFVGFLLVQYYVDFPYMDEYFHVNQTLQYTAGNFASWDPKITTPPGLYAIGYSFAKVAGSSLVALRSSNMIATLLLLYNSPESALFPLVAFYGNLYYTDLWSTFLVLTGFQLRNSYASAVCLLISLFFRQTNIVWVGLACACRITRDSNLSRTLADIPLFVRRLIKLWQYIVVAILFAAFVAWNGGIALGDKSNHEVSVHGAQILYFLMFFGLFSAPLTLDWVKSGKFLKWWYLIPLEIVAINYLIDHGTITHPFILSDNRHYTFYIWRRLIIPLKGKLMVPAYLLAWRWFSSSLDWRLLKTWLFVCAVLAVLVPSPLMEPRYYILPYLIWRQYFCGLGSTKLELLWYGLINGATVLIFCFTRTHFMCDSFDK